MSSMSALGGLLIRFAVGEQRAVDLTEELRSIHDEFIRNRDAETSYFRMGFVAAKAIERCRQLEGSDGGVHAGSGDPAAADSEGAGRPPSPQAGGGAPGSPGGPSQRSA
jgi:hypothetical protein